jgi:hypothetical protein
MLRSRLFAFLAVAAALGLAPLQAHAWQRPGHAASAAFAYDELARAHPEVVRKIVEIMAAHPDRARFDVALGDATGAERDRRLFMAMARWPDDVRETAHDHPSWHYWMSPYASPADPPPVHPHGTFGDAREAFALNLAVAGDASAAAGERAMALCWVFHVLQDVHQPLHTAQLFSKDYPDGDKGGSRSFVKTDAGATATTFHRFWDERVLTAAASVDEMEAKSRELERDYPRHALPELGRRYPKDRLMESWAREESLPLARTLAYDEGRVRTGKSPETATIPPADYAARSREAAQRRLAVASYRLADVLSDVFAAP